LAHLPPKDGLTNFRFCTAFNCAPGIPFFPASYSPGADTGHSRSLAVGTENGDFLFLAFHGVGDALATARDNLATTMRQALLPVQAIARECCKDRAVFFRGVDCSIAPGLEPRDSVGAPLEDIFPGRFGALGAVAAVSAVTAAIKSICHPDPSRGDPDGILQTGYCGLMLPVMEDVVMAQRAFDRDPDTAPLAVNRLLHMSAVCGVGVDTVPLAGDVSADSLTALYMDVGAMALRLQKPLSCRVLPMPGLKEGDVTTTDSPYLCNTRVFSL